MTQTYVAPAAHVTPSTSLRRLLTLVLPSSAAMFALYNGVQQILVPAQVEAFDPAHKVGNLALMTTFAAIASMVAIPFGGAGSDRGRSRFGRRTPWIVVTAVVSGVLMIAMGLADNLLVFGIVYTALWFSANVFQGAFNAILPDRVPVERRGVASSIIGLGGPIGVLIGVNVASRVGPLEGYSILAVILLVTTATLVLGAKEEPVTEPFVPAERTRPGLRGAVSSFFEAFASRDFTLAFISRFALFLSYFTVSGYLYFTLTDYVGADQIPNGDVAVAVATLSSVIVIAWLLVASFCGWLADRLDRRKLFVGVSAVGLAATMTVPIVSPTWAGMLVFSALSGIFIGTYFAVDLAVMSLVLPHPEQEGRDFGILAVATGLPTILSSVMAGGLITYLGGYTALYLFGSASALVAGVTILGIRKVR